MFENKQSRLDSEQEFIKYTGNLNEIKYGLKSDILKQLENRGSSDSTFSNLINKVDNVLPKDSFDSLMTIGGTFVSIQKGERIVFPKTNYRDLHFELMSIFKVVNYTF